MFCPILKASVPETTHSEAELGQLPTLPCLAHYANCAQGLYRLSRTLLCVETILGVMGLRSRQVQVSWSCPLLLAPHITMFSFYRWNAFGPCPYANMVKGDLGARVLRKALLGVYTKHTGRTFFLTCLL
jgi:hypothetical protein